MSCIFCKIISGDLQSHALYEDEQMIVLSDIKPQAPLHQLIIPKKHIATMNDASVDDIELIGKLVLQARTQAKFANIADDGYRLIWNVNAHAGQEVYHLHLHLLGGQPLGPLN